MRHDDRFQPSVVIYASDSAGVQHSATGPGQKNGQSFRVSGVVDPHKVAMEEPIRWAAFINDAYPRADGGVQRDFGVCEKTERLWRMADRAPRAAHKTVAERRHGDVLRSYMHGGDVVGGKVRF